MARVAIILVTAFLALFLGAPLAAIVRSAASGGAERLAELAFDPVILSVAGFTAGQALLSAALSLAIGLPLGLAFGGYVSRSGHTLQARLAQVLLAIPYGVPTVVAGLVAVACLGRSGLGLAYTMSAVIIAHVFLNAPWVALTVAHSRSKIPPEAVEAARTLGAGPVARFRHVLWPYLGGTALSAGIQVLSLCAMSFALVLILGGGPPVQTLETEIYARMRFGRIDLAGALVCALWELLITLVPWTALVLLRGRQARRLPVTAPRARGRARRLEGWGFALVGLIFVLPYFGVFAMTSFGSLASVRSELIRPLAISLALSLLVGLGTIAITLLAIAAIGKGRTFLPFLIALPSGVSTLVLGLGFWLAFGEWIDPFEGSLTAMVILQIVIFMPFAFRALWPVAEGSQRSLLEAARTLGASPRAAFWQIEWPRWRRPVLGMLAMVMGAALGEVAAVSLFYSENLVPLPLLISRLLGQYRFEEAQALSAFLFAISAAIITVVQGKGFHAEA